MRTILVAVDGTEKGLQTVSILGDLLRDRKDLHIVLLHCVQQVATLFPGELCVDIEESCKMSSKAQEKIGNTVLRESLLRLTAAGFPKDNVDLRLKLDSMDPAQDIIEQAVQERIQTIVVGRRGRSLVENLLLGSISSKVAQYSRGKNVWIVDAPVSESNRVLIAMEGVPECRALSYYAADLIAGCPGFQYTLLHLLPPVPPTFWDDGHILGDTEQKDRIGRIDKWKSEWTERVEKFMTEAGDLLVERGVPEGNVEKLILPTKEGVARDLLAEIDAHKFRVVLMGKKSFHERKPFLMGSHASKVLHNARATILCLVDS
jgi:nucleotide-binding universal stress UspA family protein